MEAPRFDPDFAFAETIRFEDNINALTACTKPFRLTFCDGELFLNEDIEESEGIEESTEIKISQICFELLCEYSVRVEDSAPIYDGFTFTDCIRATTECLFMYLRLDPTSLPILSDMLSIEDSLIKDNRISNDSFLNLQELVKVHVCQYVRFKNKVNSLTTAGEISWDAFVTLLDDEEARPFLRRFLTYRTMIGEVLEFYDEVNRLKALPEQDTREKIKEIIEKFIFPGDTQVNIPFKRISFYKELITSDQIDLHIFDKDLLQLMKEIWFDASKMIEEF